MHLSECMRVDWQYVFVVLVEPVFAHPDSLRTPVSTIMLIVNLEATRRFPASSSIGCRDELRKFPTDLLTRLLENISPRQMFQKKLEVDGQSRKHSARAPIILQKYLFSVSVLVHVSFHVRHAILTLNL